MSIGNIDLGLCCINMTLREKKPSVFVNRTCRLETANDKGLNFVQNLCLQNLQDCLSLLDWNKQNGINSYRLSSDMFPHLSNPSFYGCDYDLFFAQDLLYSIGDKGYEYNQRLSMHPGQYNQIGSKSEQVFEKTILDLSCHCKILDKIEEDLDMGENMAIICIHGGGIYGDKKTTIERWCKNFYRLPENVQRRIAIENCEKCYNVNDCLEISERLNIPVIFDLHHYECYELLHPEEKKIDLDQALKKVFSTWEKRNLKPYCHISQQGKGKTGHHSDYITEIPQCFLKIKTPFTLDIEAKMKERAIMRLVKK
jgi:UV DNA damage endonuclease